MAAPECTCVYKRDDHNELIHKHCPLHRAAAEMYEVLEKSSSWFNEIYPADMFTGESGDATVVRIRDTRDSGNVALAHARGEK